MNESTEKIRVGVVADDLTGACDTAVQFVRAGWQTELQIRQRRTRADVIAVSTASRAMPEDEAADAVRRAVDGLRAAGVTRLYKKIDSTLRGPVLTELRAALECWSSTAFAVVCPAFPAAGRVVVDGMLSVDGVPVAETAIAHDPVTPVTESHIPTLLRGSHVRQRPGETAEDFAARIRDAGPVAIVDARNPDELDWIADAIAAAGPAAVAVGSAGLARHLAARWAADRSAAPIIVVVTSSQPVARSQVNALVRAGARLWTPLAADLVDDVSWAGWAGQLPARIDREIVVMSAPDAHITDLPATLIPARFAKLVADICAGHQVAGIVATGGDAASAIVDELNADGIHLVGEIADGVPLGTIVGGPQDGMRIVTKAGGFGDENTLVRATDAIRHLKAPRQ